MGVFFLSDGWHILFSESKFYRTVGKPRTLVVKNPHDDKYIQSVINEMVTDRDSFFIPSRPMLIHRLILTGTRKDEETGEEKMFSVYAIRFYFIIHLGSLKK